MHQIDEGMASYEKDATNCNDYAWDAAGFARRLWRFDPKRTRGQAVAAGLFCYQRDDGQNHAINIFIVADADNKPALIFYEPQARQIITLSPKERSSCLMRLI